MCEGTCHVAEGHHFFLLFFLAVAGDFTSPTLLTMSPADNSPNVAVTTTIAARLRWTVGKIPAEL